jgi:hypothetical protein
MQAETNTALDDLLIITVVSEVSTTTCIRKASMQDIVNGPIYENVTRGMSLLETSSS